MISHQVQDEAVAVLDELHPRLVMKAGSHSGTELHRAELGMGNPFLAENSVFRRLTKRSRTNLGRNLTLHCDGEMPHPRQEPALQECVSRCTIKSQEIWIAGSGPSEAVH